MKNTIKSLFLVLCLAITVSCTHKKAGCSYRADPASVQFEWTAFKTSEKVPVKGKFLTAPVTGPTTGKSFSELLTGMQMEIDTASLETGDAGRNVTIVQFFFEKFAANKIKASVESIQGDEQKGVLQIAIEMNGVKKTIPFDYQVSSEGLLDAKSTIQLFDFNLQTAFDSLHQACGDKHTGKDGIAKTWEMVELHLMGKFTKECK